MTMPFARWLIVLLIQMLYGYTFAGYRQIFFIRVVIR